MYVPSKVRWVGEFNSCLRSTLHNAHVGAVSAVVNQDRRDVVRGVGGQDLQRMPRVNGTSGDDDAAPPGRQREHHTHAQADPRPRGGDILSAEQVTATVVSQREVDAILDETLVKHGAEDVLTPGGCRRPLVSCRHLNVRHFACDALLDGEVKRQVRPERLLFPVGGLVKPKLGAGLVRPLSPTFSSWRRERRIAHRHDHFRVVEGSALAVRKHGVEDTPLRQRVATTLECLTHDIDRDVGVGRTLERAIVLVVLHDASEQAWCHTTHTITSPQVHGTVLGA